MNIWIIGRGYPTTSNRMWGSFELEQAKMLARYGHEVSYIALTLSFFNRKDPRGARYFKEEGVHIHTLSHFYFPGKTGVYLEKFEDGCWNRLFIQAECISGKPDLIHVHYPSMISSINEIEKYRNQRVKIFVTEHWSRVLLHDLKKHELRRLEYYGANADCFACVGEPLREEVKKLVPVSVPMRVVPNIVSPLFFDAVPEKERRGFTFIGVGRFVALKQFDVIIDQFQKVFKDQSEVRLVLIGAGKEKTKLENSVLNHSQILFKGELDLKDVAKQITEADALISFSKYETFAVPVTEAWACGKPVIVSNGSGVASFVNDENGVVAVKDDPDSLGIAMRYIYENRNRFESESISIFAKAHFSDSAVMDQLNDMYHMNTKASEGDE